MKTRILIVFALLGSLLGVGQIVAEQYTFTWVSCDGTVAVRTGVGKIQMLQTDKNIPGCLGPKWVDPAESSISESIGYQDATGSVVPSDDGSVSIDEGVSEVLVDEYTPAEDQIDNNTDTATPQVIPSEAMTSYDSGIDGPLLDLAQVDIVAYRTELLRQQQIQYANAVRSLRMRHAASMQSKTDAYLLRNDPVVVTGSANGWTAVQGATLSVTDIGENTISPDTTGKADGYIATRLLRNPNPSDLVRLRQADQQFWSDIARVNVAHSVNVRAHPWYGARILFVLSDKTPLYVVSTVDNWSEVITDDRTLHGYIRSDYLTIEKHQRVEVEPVLR